MGILEIGLTFWAWNRGWGKWALLPVIIGLCLLILIALVLYDAGVLRIYAPSIGGFIFVDVAVITTLIFMVAKPRNKSGIFGKTTSLNPLSALRVKCYREADKSGSIIKNQTVPLPHIRAKLILPNGIYITINGIIRPIGREDFEGLISSTALRYISRQHFWIRSDKRKYFIEDYQSTNGTKLNNIDIKGKGLHLLHDGDNIDIAGIVVLTFTSLL